MSEVLKQLELHLSDRSLVSLRRDEIDENSLQGFILGYSDELTLIQHIYDFNHEGLNVVNTPDITSIDSTDTAQLHRLILAEEGLIPDIGPFDDAPLSAWKDLLGYFAATNPIVILECEQPEDDVFLIGRIARLTDYEAHIHYFNGAAEWEADPRKMTYEYITRFQVFTNYTNKYQAYFERHPERDFLGK